MMKIRNISFIIIGVLIILVSIVYNMKEIIPLYSKNLPFGIVANYTNEYPIHFEIDDAEGDPIIEQGFIFSRSSGFEVNEIIKYGYNHNSIMVICTDKYNGKHYLVSFKTGHKTKSGYSEVSFKEINERNYISEKKNYKWIFVRKLKSH